MNLWIANAAEQLMAEWDAIEWIADQNEQQVNFANPRISKQELQKMMVAAWEEAARKRIYEIIEWHYEERCIPTIPRNILVCQLCGGFIAAGEVHRCKPQHSE